MNVHSLMMIQNWIRNVDLQLILDAHAVITCSTKYASKAEKSGRSLQSVIETVVKDKESTDSRKAIRSAMIRSLGSRYYCEIFICICHLSIDLEVDKITAKIELYKLKKRLLHFFS